MSPKQPIIQDRLNQAQILLGISDRIAALESLDGEVTPESLLERGMVRRGKPVKILGDGELSKALQIRAHKFSRSAKEKIEAAFGELTADYRIGESVDKQHVF